MTKIPDLDPEYKRAIKTIEHETDSEDCWCKPRIVYLDDAIIIVHNKVPLVDGPDTETVLQ